MTNITSTDPSDISDHFDTQKKSAMLLIVCDKQILLQQISHEGGFIYDTFGTFVDNTDPLVSIMTTQKDNTGTSYKVKPCGTFIEYINKPLPDGRVQLTVQAYVLNLSNDQRGRLSLKENQTWFSLQDIDKEDSIRQDDKLIFERIIEDKNLDIIIDIEQMEKWIKAKLLDWAEYIS